MHNKKLFNSSQSENKYQDAYKDLLKNEVQEAEEEAKLLEESKLEEKVQQKTYYKLVTAIQGVLEESKSETQVANIIFPAIMEAADDDNIKLDYDKIKKALKIQL